jgi:hypothetical protein
LQGFCEGVLAQRSTSPPQAAFVPSEYLVYTPICPQCAIEMTLTTSFRGGGNPRRPDYDSYECPQCNRVQDRF